MNHPTTVLVAPTAPSAPAPACGALHESHYPTYPAPWCPDTPSADRVWEARVSALEDRVRTLEAQIRRLASLGHSHGPMTYGGITKAGV